MNDTLRDNLHDSLHILAVAAAKYLSTWMDGIHDEYLTVNLLEHANALLDAAERYDRTAAAEAMSDN